MALTNADQSQRLLSLAAVLDGMSWTEAVRIDGMERQTLRIRPASRPISKPTWPNTNGHHV